MKETSAAAHLNESCFCLTLDRKALCAALEKEAGDPAFCRTHVMPRSNLFSNVPVFLPASSIAAMQDVVEAVHAVSRLPGYRERVLSWAPEIARADSGPSGVFMGFDFHLTGSGPKLIEVNTNAGGAFLNELLAKAQLACCREMKQPFRFSPGGSFRDDVSAMFEAEWRLHGEDRPLRRIAIVDDQPEEQYLFPEFVLAREMLARAGYAAAIAAPEALRFEGGRLLLEGDPVDLVYNRLVDFALEEPRHAALRMAYVSRAAAVTPNPHNHALMADKRNLVLLSDPEGLAAIGVETRLRDALLTVPRTVVVEPVNAEDLWRERKSLFFKPMRGYGSKAVYRGEKVTRGVFEEILKGEYVAQAFAPPSERMMRVQGVAEPRKLDVRLYAYEGRTLLAAARLYQGQATNFRTPGGGFAPVFLV
jgi:glutathione synthase/RimK-type ligase-like ATP-grasp enzyme